MNIHLNTILAAFLALTALGAPAAARGVGHTVRFAPGLHSAHYQGHIRGYDYDSYFFLARRGQHLNVHLRAPNLSAMLFNASLADSQDVGNGAMVLPATGRYELRVLQMRNDARKGRQQFYNLGLEIW